MDPDTAAMFADLANIRRDDLSAPRGSEQRRNGPYVNDHERDRVADEQRSRRGMILAGPAVNEKHAMVQLWNSASTFGSDDVAEQLEDRWGGQGHRAALTERLRNGGGGAGKSGQPDHGGDRGDRHHGHRPQHFQQERQPRPVADTNRLRAPSPRAAGVVRFVRGQPVSSTARGPVAAALRIQKNVLVARFPGDRRKTNALAPQVPLARNQPEAATPPDIACSTAATPPPSAQLSVPPATASTRYSEADRPRERATFTMSAEKIRAIAAAESRGHPGEGVDPQILRIARQKLAEDAVLLARNPEAHATKQYYSTHKSRAWLLQPAVDTLAGRSISPDIQAELTVGAVVEQALFTLRKEESLPSPPSSIGRPRGSPSALRSLEAFPSSERATAGGLLSVNFYDSEGNHRVHRLFEVASPVKVNVTIISKHGEYDPLQMASEMEALAEHMTRHF